MPSDFVPFLASGGKIAGAPNHSTSQPPRDNATASGAFAALVPAPPAAAPAPPGTAAGCAHAPASPPAPPVVTLKREGDRVTHIHIQCACGQVVELECAY